MLFCKDTRTPVVMETSALDPPPCPRPHTCMGRGDRAQSAAYGDTCCPLLLRKYKPALSWRHSFKIDSQAVAAAIPLAPLRVGAGQGSASLSLCPRGEGKENWGPVSGGPRGLAQAGVSVSVVTQSQDQRVPPEPGGSCGFNVREGKTSCTSVARDSFATRLHAEAEPPAGLLSSQGHSAAKVAGRGLMQNHLRQLCLVVASAHLRVSRMLSVLGKMTRGSLWLFSLPRLCV